MEVLEAAVEDSAIAAADAAVGVCLELLYAVFEVEELGAYELGLSATRIGRKRQHYMRSAITPPSCFSQRGHIRRVQRLHLLKIPSLTNPALLSTAESYSLNSS